MSNAINISREVPVSKRGRSVLGGHRADKRPTQHRRDKQHHLLYRRRTMRLLAMTFTSLLQRKPLLLGSPVPALPTPATTPLQWIRSTRESACQTI